MTQARERGRELRALDLAAVFTGLDVDLEKAVTVYFPTTVNPTVVAMLVEAMREGFEKKET